MKRQLVVTLTICLLAPLPSFAKKSTPDSPARKASGKDGGAAAGAKKKDKPFAEVVAGHEVIEGLFTFYRDDDEGSVLMEIKPDQLGELYLASLTRSAGDGFYFDSSAMLGEFPFELRRRGKRVQMFHKNVYFRADGDTAIARALERGVSDSLIAAATIKSAPHPERRSLLVDASEMFLQDIVGIKEAFGRSKTGPKYKFDKSNSYFGPITSFVHNSEIPAVLHFHATKTGNSPTLPDQRSFQHTYNWSLSILPETEYEPRLADDRVGHFQTMYQDYSSVLRDTPYVRYINRWALVKAEPRLPLSPPRNPIVYWMENTIPVEWRGAVREGIELWNGAFEAIGFEDAIVVKQMPDDADWDPADIRYTTVRWMVQPGAGYAVGPSRTNPFTGEIYDADIRISADMVRYIMLRYDEFADPIGEPRQRLRERYIGRPNGRELCDYASGLAEQGAYGWAVLEARGMVTDPLSAEAQQYIHDYLVHLVAHEVGHTLGLRHNFKGSIVHPTAGLHDRALTEAQGISSSHMDYVPINLAPEGQAQGQYYMTTLGPYDYWAIEYAYRPLEGGTDGERAELNKIAARSAEPLLAYATDEDAFGGPRGMDPTATRWDIGSDSIEWYRKEVDIAEELFRKMETEFERDGERYVKLRQVFNRGLGQYRNSVRNVAKYVGGLYHQRDHVGDPNGRLPFRPVPAETQREAMTFLTSKVFGPDAFRFEPSLLNKLAPERHSDFTGAVWRTQRIDYPLHDVVLALQRPALAHLYDPILMSRMIDNELRFGSDSRPFTLADLFGEMRGAVWSELRNGTDVNSFRRALQRAHLQKLIRLVVAPAAGTPADACALARADLVSLRGSMEKALGGTSLDAYSRAHLGEGRAMIDAALDAGLERKLR